MIKIRKSISIKAPVDRVFEYLTTPQNLLEIWPSLVEVTNAKRSSDGTNSFDWTYKMAGLRFRGHCSTVEVDTNRRIVMKNDKGIESVFRWQYAGENGGMKLTLEIEYKIPLPLLEKLAGGFIERLNEHEAELLLQNLKSRMEVGTKATTGKAKTEKRHSVH